MKITMLKRCAVLGALLLCSVTGCGFAALPTGTEKAVSPKDVIGRWQYNTDYNTGTVRLELKPNGNYIETRVKNVGGSPTVVTGTWRLSGSNVIFDGMLTPDFGSGKLTKKEIRFSVVDGYWPSPSFVLFGGDGYDDDPDTGDMLKKL